MFYVLILCTRVIAVLPGNGENILMFAEGVSNRGAAIFPRLMLSDFV